MISHRGISVITPLPFGEGKGEGPLTYRGISVITPLPFGGGEGGGANFLSIPLSFREQGELATRTCPSTFKNMLFLTQEERLQRARRACSQMLFVTS